MTADILLIASIVIAATGWILFLREHFCYRRAMRGFEKAIELAEWYKNELTGHEGKTMSAPVHGRCSTALRAMVLIYEERLTHSVWQDYGGMIDDETGEEIPRSESEMFEDLKAGVREGRWVGWRLHRIEREAMGNVD